MAIRRVLLCLPLLAAFLGTARGDKIDDLTRALMQDPSYKVRVQAALVLGKLSDRRAVPALMQALKDENESVRGVAATSLGRIGDKSAANALLQASNDSSEFVATQAKKALALVSGGSSTQISATPRAGARFYLAIGIAGTSKGGPQYADLVRTTLTKELQKLPDVTLSVAGGGEPSAQVLSQKKLQGYLVDLNIARLSVSPSGGSQQVDCDLKAIVQTYPGRSIKMMTTEGASLQTGSGPSEEQSAKKDCLSAAVEAVREDVGKFLKTLE
jgi:hypothetical protein